MDKYDRNIFDLFKYYNRECRTSKKVMDSETEPETRRNSKFSDRSDFTGIIESCQSLIDTNRIILNSAYDVNDIHTVGLINDLLFRNSKYVNYRSLSDDLKVMQNTISVFNNRISSSLMFPRCVFNLKNINE
jgi:hypothetical protein